MMDSQEKSLQQVNEVNETPANNEVTSVQGTEAETQAEVANQAQDSGSEEGVQPHAESPRPGGPGSPEPSFKKNYASKAEVLERIKELAHSEETPEKGEVEFLKTIFYKLHGAEREAQQKAFLEGGGDPESYQVVADPIEEAFKAEMIIIKEKRAKLFLQQEEEKKENLLKKQEIIEKIKELLTSPEEANKSYQAFKQLQEQWNKIKNIPIEKANELWRNYQHQVEQFYDLLKLNSEAREYDFKKNLETKMKLCEIAENLAHEEDIISAFHQLQELHNQYKEAGPVAKELREEIWQRFKAASTVINKKHQQHFEQLRAKEEENLMKKTILCEQVEHIAKEEYKTAGEWEKQTKAIIAIQNEWKGIGFAPQKMNVKIFERFRSACDEFFGRKANFFKQLKESFAENAEKKRELVEKAKALKDSKDWKSTSDKLIALQKEWKTIGVVPKKLGDQLWNEFIEACNHFFEERNKVSQGTRSEEHANLDKKLNIIEQLKAVVNETGENVQETVHKLIEEYNQIGHVPYKEKDKLYKEYHDTLDKIYKELNISVARKRLDKFKSNIKSMMEKGEEMLDNERARLMRRYEQMKQEINTYENNLGFLNAASKKGNSLLDEMNRKVQKLKDEMNLVREKIKAIDAENKNAEENVASEEK